MDCVEETTIDRPALDAEQLGLPCAFHQPLRRSQRYGHREEKSERVPGGLFVEVVPDDHSLERRCALEHEHARGDHLDTLDDPRAPEGPRPGAIVLDDEQTEREACVETRGPAPEQG